MPDPTLQPGAASPAAPVPTPVSLLANDFYGEPAKAAAQPAPPVVVPPQGDDTAAGAGDDTAPGGEGDDTIKGSGDGEGDEERVEPTSLTELAQHLEVEPDWLMNLKVPTKVNGKVGEVSIADAIKSVQIAQATEQELSDAKTKAQGIIAEAQGRRQEIETAWATVGKLVEKAEATINAETKGIDWVKLREDDPAQYAAKKEEIRERREALKALKDEAKDEFQRNMATQRQQQTQALRDLAQANYAQLISKPLFKDWSDQDKAKAGKTRLFEYLTSNKDAQFTKDEVANAVDHRLVILAEKARLYDEAQTKLSAAKKRVITIPKTMKSGSRSDDHKTNGAAKKDDPVSILYG